MYPAEEKERKRLKPYEAKLIAAAVVIIVIVAGFGIYYSIENRKPGPGTIVICTYSSFMQDGMDKNRTYQQIFGTFEKEYNVNIVVDYSSIGLLSSLESQKNNPRAGIVIGLTNMQGVQAVNDNLLVKYTPPSISSVNSTLLQEMGPAARYLTPYEYSYLGIDYNKTNFQDGVFNPSFASLLTGSNASSLLLENPTTSDTGEGFLLWEIAYYTYVLHENWTTWWTSMKPYLSGHVYSSWCDAFTQFESGSSSDLLVSYLSDPAYNLYFGYGNYTGSAVTQNNGTEYGWRTIYNVGIVNNSGENLSIEEDFVNYMLSGNVQQLVPLNEWMYPANGTIALPSYYSVTENQSGIVPLNNYINATDISNNIGSWDNQWLGLMD